MIKVREYEPLLKEDKDKLFFKEEDHVQEERPVEVKAEESVVAKVEEKMETVKREVIDAAEEIRREYTKEISLEQIALEQNKEVPLPILEEKKEELNIPVIEEQEEVKVSDIEPSVVEEKPQTDEPKEDKVSQEELEKTVHINPQELVIATTEIEESKTQVIEPIKEEKTEEKKEEPKKEQAKKKSTLSLIVTIILSALCLYLLGRTIYGFYLGFKYKDYVPEPKVEEKQEQQNETNEPISLDSVILQNTYNRFKTELQNNRGSLVSKLYAKENINATNLNVDDIALIVFSNIKGLASCESGETTTIDSGEVKRILKELFNKEEYIDVLTSKEAYTYGNFNVIFNNESGAFSINYISCENASADYTQSVLEKSNVEGDFLYLYERFGYFEQTGEQNYNVYKDGLKNELVTTYVKTDMVGSFNDLNLLALYKWTFKKGENNTYYFHSIEPVNE